jgi:hypothetical protein
MGHRIVPHTHRVSNQNFDHLTEMKQGALSLSLSKVNRVAMLYYQGTCAIPMI